MEEKNHYHLIVMHITSPSLGTPVLPVVSGILVGTSADLLIVIYEQHIAVLLVMMIVDSISTSDTVVYTVLYVGVLYTTMVNSSLIITSLNCLSFSYLQVHQRLLYLLLLPILQ